MAGTNDLREYAELRTEYVNSLEEAGHPESADRASTAGPTGVERPEAVAVPTRSRIGRPFPQATTRPCSTSCAP